jgi:hypothetical protein
MSTAITLENVGPTS